MLKLSIIVAGRNNSKQLAVLLRAIASCISSVKCFSIEVLIADGGSTDDTVSVINSYSEMVTWWVSELDTGVYNAWNKALVNATGDWICFIGSDDFFTNSQVLTDVLSHLKNAQELGLLFAYGPVNLYSWAQSKTIGRYNPKPDELARTLSSGRFILHSGSFHHRLLFEKYGKFDETYRIAGDYALLLKYLKSNMAYYIPFPVINMGIEGMSLGRSFRFNWRSFKENIRAYKSVMNGFPFRIYVRFLVKMARSVKGLIVP
jgi:glycosyltransferase involved in cell wall biosynthesis